MTSDLRTTLRRGALFAVALLGVELLLTPLADVLVRLDDTIKIHWLYQQERPRYDYAIVGSSAAEGAIHGDTFLAGSSATLINLAAQGSAYPEQLLRLRWFLRDHQVDTLILAADPWGLNRGSVSRPFREYDFFAYLGDPLIRDALRERFGARALTWEYVPGWRYVAFNTQAGWVSPVRALVNVEPFDAYGSRLRDRGFGTDSLEAARRDKSEAPLHQPWQRAFEDMLDLSIQSSQRVVVYLSPELHEVLPYRRDRAEVLAYYRAVLQERGLELISFEGEPFTQDRANFADVTHFNAQGAQVFSAALRARCR